MLTLFMATLPESKYSFQIWPLDGSTSGQKCKQTLNTISSAGGNTANFGHQMEALVVQRKLKLTGGRERYTSGVPSINFCKIFIKIKY